MQHISNIQVPELNIEFKDDPETFSHEKTPGRHTQCPVLLHAADT